jgi:hypothetical protein
MSRNKKLGVAQRVIEDWGKERSKTSFRMGTLTYYQIKDGTISDKLLNSVYARMEETFA